MRDLSVGECLRAADQTVRQMTFDLGAGADPRPLITAWPALADASQQLLSALHPDATPSGVRQVRAALTSSTADMMRPQQRPGQRMVAATGLLTRAATLVDAFDIETSVFGRRRPTDLEPVTSHVLAIVAVTAHVVRSSCEHQARRLAGGTPRHPGTAVYGVAALTDLSARLRRVEDVTLHAVQRASLPDPDPDPRRDDTDQAGQLEHHLARWQAAASTVLGAAAVSVADLRSIAQMSMRISEHTTHLVAAAAHSGLLPAPLGDETARALEVSASAWARTGRLWPASMVAETAPTPTAGLHHAAITLNQTLAAITHPGPQWAATAELAEQAQLGRMLGVAVRAHQDHEQLANAYHAGATRTVNSGTLTVSRPLGMTYSGRVSAGSRVPVARDRAPWNERTAQYLHVAVAGTASTLSTAHVLREDAVTARARLPLSMTHRTLDAQIRARIQRAQHTAQAGRSGRPSARTPRP